MAENILFCGNNKAFDGILISALSIIKYYREPLDVYIFTADLRDIKPLYSPICWQQALFLEEILTAVCPDSRVRLYDLTQDYRGGIGMGANRNTVYTPYALLRLYADRLPVKRLLYLDADTIVCGDIAPLFEKELEGYEVAGVRDYVGKWFIDYNYMNAGVLFFNMELCRSTGIFERAREMCCKRRMWFPDQTSLNRLCRSRCFLPRRYNEQRAYRSDTVIQHFCKSLRLLPYIHTINVKPWEIDRLHQVYHLSVHDEVLTQYEHVRECLKSRLGD